MITSLLWRLIRRYANMALDGASLKGLSMSFWSGTVHLVNTHIRVALLQTLLSKTGTIVPLVVNASHIDEIRLVIPWTRLFLAPFEVRLRGVHVEVELGIPEDDADDEVSQALFVEDGGGGGDEEGVLMALQRRILASLELRIESFSVRLKFRRLSQTEAIVLSVESLLYRSSPGSIDPRTSVANDCTTCNVVEDTNHTDPVTAESAAVIEVAVRDLAMMVEDELVQTQMFTEPSNSGDEYEMSHESPSDSLSIEEERRKHFLLGPTHLQISMCPGKTPRIVVIGDEMAPLVARIRDRDIRLGQDLVQQMQFLISEQTVLVVSPQRSRSQVLAADIARQVSNSQPPPLSRAVVGAAFDQIENLQQFEESLDHKFELMLTREDDTWKPESFDVDHGFVACLKLPRMGVVLLQNVQRAGPKAQKRSMTEPLLKFEVDALTMFATKTRGTHLCVHFTLAGLRASDLISAADQVPSMLLRTQPELSIQVRLDQEKQIGTVDILCSSFKLVAAHRPLQLLLRLVGTPQRDLIGLSQPLSLDGSSSSTSSLSESFHESDSNRIVWDIHSVMEEAEITLVADERFQRDEVPGMKWSLRHFCVDVNEDVIRGSAVAAMSLCCSESRISTIVLEQTLIRMSMLIQEVPMNVCPVTFTLDHARIFYNGMDCWAVATVIQAYTTAPQLYPSYQADDRLSLPSTRAMSLRSLLSLSTNGDPGPFPAQTASFTIVVSTIDLVLRPPPYSRQKLIGSVAISDLWYQCRPSADRTCSESCVTFSSCSVTEAGSFGLVRARVLQSHRTIAPFTMLPLASNVSGSSLLLPKAPAAAAFWFRMSTSFPHPDRPEELPETSFCFAIGDVSLMDPPISFLQDVSNVLSNEAAVGLSKAKDKHLRTLRMTDIRWKWMLLRLCHQRRLTHLLVSIQKKSGLSLLDFWLYLQTLVANATALLDSIRFHVHEPLSMTASIGVIQLSAPVEKHISLGTAHHLVSFHGFQIDIDGPIDDDNRLLMSRSIQIQISTHLNPTPQTRLSLCQCSIEVPSIEMFASIMDLSHVFESSSFSSSSTSNSTPLSDSSFGLQVRVGEIVFSLIANRVPVRAVPCWHSSSPKIENTEQETLPFAHQKDTRTLVKLRLANSRLGLEPNGRCNVQISSAVLCQQQHGMSGQLDTFVLTCGIKGVVVDIGFLSFDLPLVPSLRLAAAFISAPCLTLQAQTASEAKAVRVDIGTLRLECSLDTIEDVKLVSAILNEDYSDLFKMEDTVAVLPLEDRFLSAECTLDGMMLVSGSSSNLQNLSCDHCCFSLFSKHARLLKIIPCIGAGSAPGNVGINIDQAAGICWQAHQQSNAVSAPDPGSPSVSRAAFVTAIATSNGLLRVRLSPLDVQVSLQDLRECLHQLSDQRAALLPLAKADIGRTTDPELFKHGIELDMKGLDFVISDELISSSAQVWIRQMRMNCCFAQDTVDLSAEIGFISGGIGPNERREGPLISFVCSKIESCARISDLRPNIGRLTVKKVAAAADGSPISLVIEVISLTKVEETTKLTAAKAGICQGARDIAVFIRPIISIVQRPSIVHGKVSISSFDVSMQPHQLVLLKEDMLSLNELRLSREFSLSRHDQEKHGESAIVVSVQTFPVSVSLSGTRKLTFVVRNLSSMSDFDSIVMTAVVSRQLAEAAEAISINVHRRRSGIFNGLIELDSIDIDADEALSVCSPFSKALSASSGSSSTAAPVSKSSKTASPDHRVMVYASPTIIRLRNLQVHAARLFFLYQKGELSAVLDGIQAESERGRGSSSLKACLASSSSANQSYIGVEVKHLSTNIAFVFHLIRMFRQRSSSSASTTSASSLTVTLLPSWLRIESWELETPLLILAQHYTTFGSVSAVLGFMVKFILRNGLKSVHLLREMIYRWRSSLS